MTELSKKYRNYLWLFLGFLLLLGYFLWPGHENKPSTKLEMNVEDLLITGPVSSLNSEEGLSRNRYTSPEEVRLKSTPSSAMPEVFAVDSGLCPDSGKPLPELFWYSNLRKLSSSGLKILFVLSPNFKTDSRKYESIAKTILNHLQVPAAIAVLKYRSQNPNPLELVTSLQRARNYAADCGFSPNNSLFLIGHGLGGIIAQKVATKITSLRGLILLSSFMTKTDDPEIGSGSITKFPLPVLTLSGEWDGNTRLGFLYREFKEFEKSFQGGKGDIEVLRTAPVVVLDQLNGSMFLDGVSSHRDIPTDIRPEIAIQQIALAVGSFADLSSPEVDKTARKEAAKTLAKFAKKTNKILKPYGVADYFDQQFCLNVLKHFGNQLSWEPNDWACKLIRDKDLWDASISQPTFYRQGGKNLCNVHQFFHKERNHLDLGSRPFGSESVHCKFKSAKAMGLGFGLPVPENFRFNCLTANQHVFKKAKESLSNKQRAKLDQEGRQLVFKDDIVAADPIEWLGQPLELDINETEIVIQGVSLETKLDQPNIGGRGLHYCKLVSFSRAVEILTVDALLP